MKKRIAKAVLFWYRNANDNAMKLMRELDSDKGIGLIKSVRQELGKPNLIYVKNFVSGSGEEEKD